MVTRAELPLEEKTHKTKAFTTTRPTCKDSLFRTASLIPEASHKTTFSLNEGQVDLETI